MSTTTPEAVVGLDLQGKGFQEVNKALKEQLTTWDRIGNSVGRVGDIVSKVGATVGIGAVLNDYRKLEDITARIALNVGYIRSGGNGHEALRKGIVAGVGYGADPVAVTQGIAGLTARVGGTLNPSSARGLSDVLSRYSQGYGIDPRLLVDQVGALQMFSGRVGTGSTNQLLAQLSNQAAKSGNANQFPQMLSAVAAVVGALGGAHPGTAAAGMPGNIGALYGAVSKANPIFRDPGTFAAGVMGVDGAVTQAYRDPRMTAMLTMAGVDYWQARGGLAGKGGRSLAKKILGFANSHYSSAIERDLFLRSNFGDVSADMLNAFADGQVTYDQLMHPGGTGQANKRAGDRARELQNTPTGKANDLRSDAQDKGGNLFDHLKGALPTTVAGAVALYAAGRLAPKAFRAALRRIRAGKATSSAEKAAAAAAESQWFGEEGAAGAGARAGERAAVEAGEAAVERGAGTRAAAAAAARAGARLGLRAVPFVGAGLMAYDFLSSTGEAPDGSYFFRQNAARAGNQWKDMTKRFGAGWFADPKAIAYARKHHMIDVGVDRESEMGSDWFLRKAIQTARGAAHLDPRTGKPMNMDPEHVFGRAVARFEHAVKAFAGAGNGRASTTAGGAASLNAANLGRPQDLVAGASMIFARMAGSGGAGGGSDGTTFVSNPVGVPGGGGSGGGDGGGGGWQSCTLTWYDPALGGINSSHGQKDPHAKMANGQPYQASAMTCAAPKAYAFGTRITFKANGKTVTCTVTDRGGSITGSHFDLSRGASAKLGNPSSGKFKVAGGGAGGGSTSHGDSQSGTGTPPGLAPLDTKAHLASWMGSAPSGSGSAGGGGRGGDIVVNIDGREIDRTKRLTRGRA